MQLTDQVAIITGSARGIGSAIALCLAREGAHTVVADINAAGAWEAAAEIEALGRRAIAVETDVVGQDQVQAMVERAIEFGRVGILVNNAGNAVLTPLLETTAAVWDYTLKPHTVWHLLHRRFVDLSFIFPHSGRLQMSGDRHQGMRSDLRRVLDHHDFHLFGASFQ
jgi:NAD(P)-dependent dehydrogenase (short-subunit alcohol dehydrogenase family)